MQNKLSVNKFFLQPNKTLVLFLKLIIVGVAIYTIYLKIYDSSIPEFHFKASTLIFLSILSFFNWLFEILKWKSLANTLQKTTFKAALKQSLSAHTVAISTPNKIGEYGAKILFFRKKFHKRIVVLNFIGNSYQMFTTVIFGAFGLFIFLQKFNTITYKTNYILLICFLSGLVFLLVFKKKLLLKRVYNFFKNIPTTVHFKVALYATIRYLIFSHQFYFLLRIFDIPFSYTTLIPIVFSTYLIASSIPGFSLFDFAIKGSVALWLFGFLGINEIAITSIIFTLWIFNFAIPALIGSYFVFQFKLQNQLHYDSN